MNSVGRSLYTLVQALRIQAEKGPVDAVTGAAMYTLNGNYLLRERIPFERLRIRVTADVEGKMSVPASAGNSTQPPLTSSNLACAL